MAWMEFLAHKCKGKDFLWNKSNAEFHSFHSFHLHS